MLQLLVTIFTSVVTKMASKCPDVSLKTSDFLQLENVPISWNT